MSEQPHTDMENKEWVSVMPAALRPYLYLARLDRPIGTWLLLLPGWWAIMLASGGALALNYSDTEKLALFGLGAIVMRAAGCIINDLWDKDLDTQVERTKTRPLAAGTVSRVQAAVFLTLLLLIGLVILLKTNSLVTILLGFLSVPMIALYPFMKRVTWWPQLFLGIVFNLGALMGWAAIEGVIGLPALLLYCGGIFWTLGYDTVYAHQDREDDERIGIRSSALKLGAASKIWVTRFFAAAWLLIAGAFAAHNAGIISCLLLVPAGAHLVWQMRRWDMDDPANCLSVFRASRDFGLIVLLAAAL